LRNENNSFSYFYKLINEEELFILKEFKDYLEGKNLNLEKENKI
jgi:hypothetical protein